MEVKLMEDVETFYWFVLESVLEGVTLALFLTRFYTFFLLFWLHLVLTKTMVSISHYKYPYKTHYFLTSCLLFSSSLFRFF